MYEMEGTSPSLTVPRRPVTWLPGTAGRRRGQTSAQGAGFPAPPTSRGRPRVMFVSSSNVFLLPPRKLRKVLRLLISSFFAIHMVSTEPGELFAFGGGCPRSYAQFIHRNLGITRERDTRAIPSPRALARCHRQRRLGCGPS
jgi:hypothetical protein